MKKRASNKKEVLKTKLKKTKTLAANRRTKQNVPDPWKEIGKKLKPIGKAYNKFIEKRKVAKQKEELKKLKYEVVFKKNNLDLLDLFLFFSNRNGSSNSSLLLFPNNKKFTKAKFIYWQKCISITLFWSI